MSIFSSLVLLATLVTSDGSTSTLGVETSFSSAPLRQSAEVNGLRLVQTVELIGSNVRVCLVLESRYSSFVATTGLREQTRTVFNTLDNRAALKYRTTPLSSPIIPPISTSSEAYAFISFPDGVRTCVNQRFEDFQFFQFEVSSRFRSWLRPGAPLPSWLADTLNGAEGRQRSGFLQPIRSNVEILSNSCVVDLSRRLVRC
jgi:hypothetical protein